MPPPPPLSGPRLPQPPPAALLSQLPPPHALGYARFPPAAAATAAAAAAQAEARRPRGTPRRRSEPQLDSCRCPVSGRVNGRQRGGRAGPVRGRSLECLQLISGQLLRDLLPPLPPNAGARSEDSDSCSEVSSYSAAVRSRRVSLNADSDASSSGVSSGASCPDLPAFVSRPTPTPTPTPTATPTPTPTPTPTSTPIPTPTPALPATGEGVTDREVELQIRDAFVPQVLYPRAHISPDISVMEERVVWYQGRNLLDLGNHIRSSPWPLQHPPASHTDFTFYAGEGAARPQLGVPCGPHLDRPVECEHCGFVMTACAQQGAKILESTVAAVYNERRLKLGLRRSAGVADKRPIKAIQ